MCRVIGFEDRWGQMQVTWIGAAAVLITHDFEREGRSRRRGGGLILANAVLGVPRRMIGRAEVALRERR
jgi:hypothetical protein